MTRIKVLIVDDSITIRAMFEEVLEQDRGFDVVGTASNAEEAMQLMQRGLPDVIALDINMPGVGGLDLLQQIRDFWHKTAVVMVSSSTVASAPVCKEAFERGAVACFDKSHLIANRPKLIKLLKEAAAGHISRAGHRSDGTTLPDATAQAPAETCEIEQPAKAA